MKILLGITGSIAATLNGKLVDQIFADLNPEQLFVYYTSAAEKILEAKKVLNPWYYSSACPYRERISVVSESDEWSMIRRDNVLHVDLGKLDRIVVAPATANTIAKIANGFADNLLTSAILVMGYNKLVIAPAMNTHMYENVIVQRNIQTLKDLGCQVVDPVRKVLYCGDEGTGALAPISEITRTLKV